jgi:hypothetical protein
VRTIETALWPLEKPTADVGVGVFLGDVHTSAPADLREGERVLLVEPNELQAEAIVRMVELNGRRWWFGDIGDPDAIQVIYPAPPSDGEDRITEIPIDPVQAE